MNLNGKTILVTGAAGSGVGAGVCRAVIEAGGRLVINALHEEQTARAVESYGALAGYAADVAAAEQVESMFASIAVDVGPLDGVVNNAGVGLNKHTSETTLADYERIEGVDLRGVWLVSRAFARQTSGGGSIVNISSVHALATMRGYALYAAVKAGVEGMTRGLAIELGEVRVRCNAVAPGYVHSHQNIELLSGWTTDVTAWVRDHTVNQQVLEREIEPIDCGWAAAFFLSDMSRAITGQVLRVDAGLTTMLYGKDFR